jgi:hypothetical protein
VKLLEKQAPHLIDFINDIPHCEAASKLSLPTLQGDMNTLQKDYNTISAALETQFPNKDKFTEIMGNFLSKAKGDLEQMTMNFKIAEDKYKECVTFYGDDPKQAQPDEFFGTVLRFAQALQEAKKQNEIAIANEEKNKRREEAKLKRVKYFLLDMFVLSKQFVENCFLLGLLIFRNVFLLILHHKHFQLFINFSSGC